jgi:ATP-binding cassette, subfamily B, bacterial MsbA
MVGFFSPTRPITRSVSDCRSQSLVVQGRPARTSEGAPCALPAEVARKPRVTPSPAPAPMKNFVRLARFAWPYRVRFALSLACAIMVALLGFANIGAVYPLLQILFNSQNCHKWIDEKVIETETEELLIQARVAEIDFMDQLVDQSREPIADFRAHLRKRHREEVDAVSKLGDQDKDNPDGMNAVDLTDPARRERALATSRVDELERYGPLVKQMSRSGLSNRRTALGHELASNRKWQNRYVRIRPVIKNWLPKDNYKTLVLLITAVMVTVAVKGLFQFLQDVLVADIMQLSLFDIRNLFFRRTMALELAKFSEGGTADLIARFTNDMESLSQGLSVVLSKMVREPLRVVSFLVGALVLNWRLTCLTLILVPISVITTYRAGKIMKRAVRKSLESMSNIYKILQECLLGIKVVKAFTMERYERRRFYVETRALYKKSVRVATIDALSDPVLEFLSLTTVAIAVLTGSYLVLRKTIFINIGFPLQLASKPMIIADLFTLYAMLAGIADPVRKLANVHSKLQRAAAASDRICTLMYREPDVTDKPGAIRMPRHRRVVEFDQVEFTYNGRDSVLRGLSLSVNHGEAIALVGPNGCGKTTLMNLLPRFWDVNGGAIRLDGHDIRDVQMRSLRNQIGMVTQETILFRGTLAENISYGSRNASRDAIIAAAKRSYAHQFISALPDGYDTLIGEHGSGLSGGQRQRIALARAMLRDPAILILDEATSAVDIQDEALIRKAIEEFARGRTTFLITHNLGSLQFVDRIVLMNAGRVEAVGTDSELRRSSTLYHRLHEIHYQRESA